MDFYRKSRQVDLGIGSRRLLTMAPIAVGDIIRAVARFRILDTDIYVNTFHMKVVVNSTVDDSAFMTELALDIDSKYQIVNGQISDELDYLDIDAQNITQNELLTGKPWPVLVSGADVAFLLPTQSAAYIFFRTLRPKTRAAIYLPGYTQTSLNPDGSIGATARTQLSLLTTDLESGFSGINIQADYGAYNKLLDRFTIVDQGIVPVRWRTQRRRRIGVGT